MSQLNWLFGHPADAGELVGLRKHFRAIKRNKLLTHVTIWMDLKGIMLPEKRQSHMATYRVIPLIQHFQSDKNHTYGEEICGCQGLGMGLGKADGCEYKGVAWGIFVVMGQFCISTVVVATQIYVWENVQNYTYTRKWVHMILVESE